MCELVLLQRMDSGEPSSNTRRMPTLPEGVRACEGIPRESWYTRVVILTNEAREDIARAICRSVDASVVVDTNERPIGDDHVAVQIAETLKEEEVPSGWMWSMHSWPIKRVFLNGASLHDHDQTDVYRKAVNAQNQRPRKGICSYKTTRERRNVDIPLKKERVLTSEAIHEVSTKSCCERNCIQPFPWSEIEAIRSELLVNGRVYNRKSVLLEVHRQVHKDSNGKEWITLKGREVCPSAWQTIHAISRATYYRYKEMASNLSRIRKESFWEYTLKGRGDSFARCGTCDEYKQLRSACTPMSVQWEKWEKVLENHLAGQKAHRELYYAHRYILEEYPEKMVTIIHDKMDHSKTASPHFSHKSKATESFMKLPIAITGMIAHGHGDVRYVHDGLDIYPMNPNHMIGSIAKLLRDLEGVRRNASRCLFTEEGEQSTLTKALLKGAEICRESVLPIVEESEGVKQLPPILTLQLDNACADNKNRWVFAFCSMLVYKRIFREVYINFLIVGHTHEDIDALFGQWSMRLKTRDYPTLPLLMKSFMDCETEPVIPHLIEEVPDFKSFVEGYLGRGGQFLEGHSKVQQFRFHMDPSGWPLMEYKHMCTDKKWLPEDGKGIRLWSETEGNGREYRQGVRGQYVHKRCDQ